MAVEVTVSQVIERVEVTVTYGANQPVAVVVSEGNTSASDASYTHNQPVPAAEWIIDHNLGFRPVVSVLDTAHNEVVGDVVHPTLNQTVLTFSVAFAGSARLT